VPLLGGALLILLVWVVAMEAGLAARGFLPSVHDTALVWSHERNYLDRLGPRGLALVGASRILLDTDIATLHAATGLQPVQLGIEGGSFLPVLAGLARDPAFRGSVIVDLDVAALANPGRYDPGFGYESWYERYGRNLVPNFDFAEDKLSTWLHGRLRSYGQGARPWTVLTQRLFTGQELYQYLRTLPDREVLADYTRVPMPYFRYFRAFRNLDGSTDVPPGLDDAALDATLRQDIAALQPLDNRTFLQGVPLLFRMVQAIEQRGGRVLFVKFPTSGYVQAIDDRRYPRKLFWDRFAAAFPERSLDTEDVPALAAFECPDGSHLDYRDREHFTQALAAILDPRLHAR
jgi:hypothetical protein